jgi:hypothetical protein
MRPIAFVYSINGTALDRVDEIKDLEVIMDGRMSLSPNNRECWILLSVFQEIFVTRFIHYAVRRLPWRVWPL